MRDLDGSGPALNLACARIHILLRTAHYLLPMSKANEKGQLGLINVFIGKNSSACSAVVFSVSRVKQPSLQSFHCPTGRLRTHNLISCWLLTPTLGLTHFCPYWFLPRCHTQGITRPVVFCSCFLKLFLCYHWIVSHRADIIPRPSLRWWLQTFMFTCLCGHVFSFWEVKHPGMELLGHILLTTSCLTFEEQPNWVIPWRWHLPSVHEGPASIRDT